MKDKIAFLTAITLAVIALVVCERLSANQLLSPVNTPSEQQTPKATNSRKAGAPTMADWSNTNVPAATNWTNTNNPAAATR